MRITVKVDINTQKILDSRGLGGDHAVNTFIANEVKRLSEQYVPFQNNGLRGSATIQPGAPAQLIYSTPYAHYQWEGLVMGGRAPKHYTGAALTYHGGGGMCGPKWTVRAMANRSDDLTRSVANYVGGRPG